MDRTFVASALPLAAVSTAPLPNTLQWNDDGQLLLLTKSAVYILTPDTGLLLKVSAIANQAQESSHGHDSSRPIGWFRTLISSDKTITHHWPVHCQDWGAVSLGSLDPILRAAAPSPSNLTAEAGCLLAVLNSNMELTIWGPAKNYLQGEWIKLLDVTAELEASEPQMDESILVRTLRIQSTCIGWSSQVDFGLAPVPHLDGSLLAVGNRAGSVTFLRFSSCDVEGSWKSQLVAQISLSDRSWVTHVAWSSWRLSEAGKCEALVACATADGSVMLVNAIQILQTGTSVTGLLPVCKLVDSFQVQNIRLYESDSCGITGMRWVDVGRRSILVYAKPGFIHLWSPEAPSGAWSGSRVIALTQNLSIRSSVLCSMSGAVYLQRLDALIICLTEGSFHVIYNLSVEPTADPSAPRITLAGEDLSHAVRMVCAKLGPDKLSAKEVVCISGMTSYDCSTSLAWVHEISQPTDFSYKHDAKHVSMFVVAQLAGECVDEELVECLHHSFNSAAAVTGETPVSRLHPLFEHLRDRQRLSRLQSRILVILQDAFASDSAVQFTLPSYTGELTPQLQREFKSSLSMHLFGWNILLSQRMRLSVAKFCQGSLNDQLLLESYKHVCCQLSSALWHHVLYTIIQHVSAVSGLLSHSDIPFILRLVKQTTMLDSASYLLQAADDMMIKITSIAPDSQSSVDKLGESCPACHAQIPLIDISSAVCPNGHVWTRCSITTFILATPMVRTCTGCNRKAFLALPQISPNRDWLPDDVRNSWLAIDLLDAARRCFFCGCNFVTLV